jgi:creatinine amidohydrolase
LVAIRRPLRALDNRGAAIGGSRWHLLSMRIRTCLVVTTLALLAGASYAAAPGVYIEAMTWTEVRDALKAGKTTVLIPIGGTEQNGPHMALGKHNVRAHALAGKVAAGLGNALVAPVLSYTPEGQVSPPAGHMRYPGTISIPDDAFKATLEGAALSFRQHGFTDIVWLGDSGNYQALIAEVATRLNRAWATTPARAHHVPAYYRTGQTEYVQALRAKGLSDAQIGTHAGAADTALLMAIDATLLRPDRMAPGASVAQGDGVAGDPRAANENLGRIGVDLIVARTVEAIKVATARRGEVNATGAPAPR